MPRKRRPGRPRMHASRKLVRRSVDLPRESWAFLGALAGRDGTSASHHVRIAVREYQESHEKLKAHLSAPQGRPLFVDPVSGEVARGRAT